MSKHGALVWDDKPAELVLTHPDTQEAALREELDKLVRDGLLKPETAARVMAVFWKAGERRCAS